MRSPVWITAGYAQEFAGEQGRNFHSLSPKAATISARAYNFVDSEYQNAFLHEKLDKYLAYRKMIERELNQRFSLIIKDTPASKAAKLFSETEMRKKLSNDKSLCDIIIPQNFAVGCRRATPGNGYLEALAGSKTTCFTETIGCITPKGFKDGEGVEYEVNTIICASGFDTSWVPRFPIVVNGKNL